LSISSSTEYLTLGMRRSQPKSACGFHVQNPSEADADLSRDQN